MTKKIVRATMSVPFSIEVDDDVEITDGEQLLAHIGRRPDALIDYLEDLDAPCQNVFWTERTRVAIDEVVTGSLEDEVPPKAQR